MEIIIFIIVISIVSNIIKAIGRAGSSVPKEVEMSEIPHDLSNINTKDEHRPPPVRGRTRGPIGTLKSQTSSKVGAKEGPAFTAVAREEVGFPSTDSPLMQTEKAQKSTKKTYGSYPGLENLTPNRLVEGIILSEILAPPKCRR